MVSYKNNVWYNLSCLLQTYCHLSIIKKLFISWQFFETYGVINNGSGWRKDFVSQCLEFDPGYLIRHFWPSLIRGQQQNRVVPDNTFPDVRVTSKRVCLFLVKECDANLDTVCISLLVLQNDQEWYPRGAALVLQFLNVLSTPCNGMNWWAM